MLTAPSIVTYPSGSICLYNGSRALRSCKRWRATSLLLESRADPISHQSHLDREPSWHHGFSNRQNVCGLPYSAAYRAIDKMAQMVSLLEYRPHLHHRRSVMHPDIRAMQSTSRSMGADRGS